MNVQNVERNLLKVVILLDTSIFTLEKGLLVVHNEETIS